MQEDYTTIEFPGYIRHSSLPLQEKLQKVFDCYGGESTIQKYLTNELPHLFLSFRPSDKCCSPLPVTKKKCNNKVLLRINNNKVERDGNITSVVSSSSTMAPFQALNRCPIQMLVSEEQNIPTPFEINASRMTKVDQPLTVQYGKDIEKKRNRRKGCMKKLKAMNNKKTETKLDDKPEQE
ncbi:Transcription factor IIIC subunit Tfc1/Sfc1 triple barrel domain-containing protein [Entamoeba marina]